MALKVRADSEEGVARKLQLEPGEVILDKTWADYQAPRNHGTLTLTNRRLVWRMGWEIIPLGHIFGQREVILPLSAIATCEGRGRIAILATTNGEFWFIIGAWPWSTKKSQQWVEKINEAIGMLNSVETTR